MANDPTNQTINDDQELAKVLAGVTAEAEGLPNEPIQQQPIQQFSPATDSVITTTPTDDAQAPEPVQEEPEPVVAPLDTITPSSNSGLDGVKADAINELRPLVDKLNIPAEEKFDTYLLLLRSTDDRALVEPAHEVAKQITDESRRAQALLDIIKEIDFLSQSAQQ